MKKAAFYTLGCKVNQYETEAMAELFSSAGYKICDFSDKADVYVINTCSVTNVGDRKSRQIIRRAKRNNPSAVIAVTGCYAQTAPKEVLSIEGVSIVIGNNDRHNIVSLVEDAVACSGINHVSDIMSCHELEKLRVKNYSNRTRAFIKVQEGCNQFCSYCIIPYARGPVRSRPKTEVIDEIYELTANGFKEIILVGIHIASYGTDIGSTSLADLIASVNEISGVERIRLSSIEPMTLNRGFVEKIKHAEKLCHHFHISLQSGCDATLRRMNRKYTTAQFRDIVYGLREEFDDAAITTDIMVGFPGETDEEFSETLSFAHEIRFADAHIFQYSQRRGTPAAKSPNQVPPKTKELRSKLITAETTKTRDEFLSRFIGKTVRVLFEQSVSDGIFEGKTDNYITVRAPSAENLKDRFKNVLLESMSDGVLKGIIID